MPEVSFLYKDSFRPDHRTSRIDHRKKWRLSHKQFSCALVLPAFQRHCYFYLPVADNDIERLLLIWFDNPCYFYRLIILNVIVSPAL